MLKNTGETYQRLVNQIFVKQIGKAIKVYVDEILIKFLKAEQHIVQLGEVFQILRKYNMKLNSAKYSFGIGFDPFLHNQKRCRGKSKSAGWCSQDTDSRKTKKDIKRLVERITALNRFLSGSSEYFKPLFQLL